MQHLHYLLFLNDRRENWVVISSILQCLSCHNKTLICFYGHMSPVQLPWNYNKRVTITVYCRFNRWGQLITQNSLHHENSEWHVSHMFLFHKAEVNHVCPLCFIIMLSDGVACSGYTFHILTYIDGFDILYVCHWNSPCDPAGSNFKEQFLNFWKQRCVSSRHHFHRMRYKSCCQQMLSVVLFITYPAEKKLPGSSWSIQQTNCLAGLILMIFGPSAKTRDPRSKCCSWINMRASVIETTFTQQRFCFVPFCFLSLFWNSSAYRWFWTFWKLFPCRKPQNRQNPHFHIVPFSKAV